MIDLKNMKIINIALSKKILSNEISNYYTYNKAHL
jgi:hypothetical protein